MREIKFRAMTKVSEDWGGYHFTSTMVYGTGIFRDPINTWLLSHDDRSALAFDMTNHIVKPETVGQFTGLLDKNGKEIYEGDIVRRKYQSQPLVVVFLGGAFLLAIEIDGSWEYIDDILEADEVIGNIHENGDLLK